MAKPEPNITVKAKEIMGSPVITIRSDASVADAAILMLQSKVGSVVVVDHNGKYVGIITERMMIPEGELVPFMRGQAFRILGKEIGDFDNIEETMKEVRLLKVSEAMNKRNPTTTQDADIADVAQLMVDKGVHHICVLEAEKPIGIISRHDLLRLFFNYDVKLT